MIWTRRRRSTCLAVVVLLCVFVFGCVTPTIRSAAAPSTTVYVTRTGERYHRGACRYLSQSKVPTTLEAARGAGYTPCKVCNPPR